MRAAFQPLFAPVLCLLLGTSLTLASATLSPASEVQLQIHDDSDQPIAACVYLTDALKQPVAVPAFPYWHDHFVCTGQASFNLPPGRYNCTIERGPEWSQWTDTLTVPAEQPLRVTANLRRLISMRDAGWRSADLHVHRPVEQIQPLMQAADLDLAPVIGWWNTSAVTTEPTAETTFQFDGDRIYSTLAGEDEREGGALLFLGLPKPLDLRVRSHEFPSPMKFVNQARELRPDVWIDIEKPFWWDVPAWLASEEMQSIGIANNHMCRAEMLANEAWGKPRDVMQFPGPHGNGYWSQHVYYRMLDAGLKLAPSAGSASGVLPNPVGYNRVYVHLDEQTPFTRDTWFAALKAGRCAVTNGPLLRVSADNTLPGTIIATKADAQRRVSLDIHLTSREPIAKVEVIVNGDVIRTLPGTNQLHQHRRIEVELPPSGWFLVRTIADVEETFRFASTAPWFISPPTSSQRISRSACEFFLDWAKQRRDRVATNDLSPDEARQVLRWHDAAITFWTNRAEHANAD